MVKSTAMPVNSTANATDTRFSVPTASAAKPVVASRPSTSVSRIGTAIRQVCTARNNSTPTSAMLSSNSLTAPFATVPNSSSSSATCPVRRTCARPACTSASLAATARSASDAA